MPRNRKQNADFFPHYVSGGKTLHTLEKRYGNDGYAFWFKLLETLAETSGHYLDLSDEATMIYIADRANLTEETALDIIELLVRLGKVDQSLWVEGRIVWVQGLVDNLAPLYSKRKESAPHKPNIRPGNDEKGTKPGRKPSQNMESGDGNQQRRVEKSREEKKTKESAREACDFDDLDLIEEVDEETQAFRSVMEATQECGWRLPVGKDEREATDCIEVYGAKWTIAAIHRAFERGHVGEWGYVKGILSGWKRKGGIDPPDSSRSPPVGTPPPPIDQATLSRIEEVIRHAGNHGQPGG